jgi:hypothetical protein
LNNDATQGERVRLAAAQRKLHTESNANDNYDDDDDDEDEEDEDDKKKDDENS